jgi:S1-C subfamily serine protease
MRFWEMAAAISMLGTVAGCATSEAYGVVGENGQVFTGQMGGGTQGQITLDNGQGTRCVGQFSGRSSTANTVAWVLIAGRPPPSYGGAGRALVTCSDGQQALIQFTSAGGESGYGFGTTRDGQPVRFTYGMTREQSASYLQVQPGSSGSAPSRPSGVIGSGTGFFVTRQGHVVTNAHVVERCRTVSVTTLNGETTTATVGSADKTNDLALLNTGAARSTVAALRGGRAVRQGEAVVAYGFPLSGALSSGGVSTSGTISALQGVGDDSRYMQMSAPVQPGNSGGPLLDMTGAVVGVVTSRLGGRSGQSAQNVNFAVKADVVRTFLASQGVTAETGTGGREFSVPDVAERARAFTVFIECKG